MNRVLAAAGGFAIGAAVALVTTQIAVLGRREFLPMDPGYRVDSVVPSPSGARDRPLRLAVLGDSTVAGVGSPTEAESMAVQLAQRVASATGRAVAVTGFGVSGARTATVLRDQLPRLRGPYDTLVIVVGANDATHVTPWRRLRRDAEAMLTRARVSAPVVVLAGTPRFAANEIIPEPLRTFVDRYAGLLRAEQRAAARAVDGVRFVDLAADASPRFLGRPDATSPDGFHPSPVGYGFWADALAPSVVATLRG